MTKECLLQATELDAPATIEMAGRSFQEFWGPQGRALSGPPVAHGPQVGKHPSARDVPSKIWIGQRRITKNLGVAVKIWDRWLIDKICW